MADLAPAAPPAVWQGVDDRRISTQLFQTRTGQLGGFFLIVTPDDTPGVHPNVQVFAKLLILLATPEGFEPPTLRFEV